MSIKTKEALAFIIFTVAFLISANAQPLVPALMIFGDSVVDVGNNNRRLTIFKANYPPYGRDFTNHQATGRFCNGKLATDIIAEILGFNSSPPAYLTPQASGKNLLTGANFASAASGYDEKTALLSNAISLSHQLENFKDYKSKLEKIAGTEEAASIIGGALYILSAGSSDFLQNYYINPLLNTINTPDQYSSHLVDIFSNFIKDLHGLGARRIGVTSLPPLGCLPLARTLFGFFQSGCVAKLNNDAQQFNKRINATATELLKQFSDLKLAVFDVFQPLYDIVKSPSDFGFKEANRGCCGTGKVETTVFLCNPISLGTCSNATEYVFWDSVHPSEACNQVLADSLLIYGIGLIG